MEGEGQGLCFDVPPPLFLVTQFPWLGGACSLLCFPVSCDPSVPAIGQGPPHSKSAPQGAPGMEVSVHCQRPLSWQEAHLGPQKGRLWWEGPSVETEEAPPLQPQEGGRADLWPPVVVKSPFRCCHPFSSMVSVNVSLQ